LERIDAKLLGVVLNRVPLAAGAARGYGYGYSYEADPGRDKTGTVRQAKSSRPSPARRPEAPLDATGPMPPVRSGR
jgi:receptor protein-tyrosine kinase